MIKDLLVSFRENFKEKTANPFLGTYFMVLLIRNWELVYSIFNFDKEYKLVDKITFIKNYLLEREFISDLIINIFISFGILIATYLLLNLSRLVVNFSEKKITPFVYKITDSKSIVLKSVYEKIRIERDELQYRLDQERDAKSKLDSQIKTLEDKLTELKIGLQKNKEQYNNENSKTMPKDYFDLLISKLESNSSINHFKDVYTKINRGDYFKGEVEIDLFIEQGLIKIHKKDLMEGDTYQLTEDGEKVYKLLRDRDLLLLS